MAYEFFGKLPIVYTDLETTGPIGSRWKAQLNENGKTHAFCNVFPEMNHNEIVGWESLKDTETFLPHLGAVLLRTGTESSQNRKRMDITKGLIQEKGISLFDLQAEGESLLDKWIYLISLGDWFSFYLAIAYQADPTEIKNINHLKEQLKK